MILVSFLTMKPSLLIILLFTLIGCKKYEQGPGFSLASKRARIINTWQVIRIENANDTRYLHSGEIVFRFYRNDEFSVQYETLGSYYSDYGTWSLSDEKQYLDLMVNDWNGNAFFYYYEIIKLKSNELILKTQDDEYWTLNSY